MICSNAFTCTFRFRLRGSVLWLAVVLGAAASSLAANQIVPNRQAPAFIPAPAQPAAVFSATPTSEEIAHVRVFEELLVPLPGAAPGDAENRALAQALAAYQQARLAAGPSEAMFVDLSAFEGFLRSHPTSAWRVSLHTNLGIEYYRRGEFTKALRVWESAWQAGKNETEPRIVAIVDRALGELARMQARLGRVEDLQALFAQAGARPVAGLGAEAYHGARGGLWSMLHKPEESFKCGPWALDSILTSINGAHPHRSKIKEYPSPAQGVSLHAVAALAKEMGMDLVPAQRLKTGVVVPTPAVVHWKLDHYGALLRHEGDRYLLQDPTFGGHAQWISQATLDEEASGYFLVAGAALQASGSWRAVSEAATQKIRGKGFPTTYPPPEPPLYPPFSQGFNDFVQNNALFPSKVAANPDGPDPGSFGDGLASAALDDISGVPQPADPPEYPPLPPAPPSDGSDDDDDDNENSDYNPGRQNIFNGGGMAAWMINFSQVDLRLRDTPLFYKPPVGPAIRFTVSYEQREANQPAALSFANFGNKWNFHWITTLTFDSNNAYVNYGESGQETFAGFTSATQSSGVATLTHTRLVRAGANIFQLIAADGSMRVFEVFDGSGRYYMTKVRDPRGNTVALAYDNQYRLITVTDAIGQVSTLGYTLAGDPLKITKITDPFGRTALFNYNPSNQLQQITDAVGMTSQFTYGTGDFVQTLVTGYGTTAFASTESGLDRTLVVTLPDGSKEMAQSLGGSTAGVPFSEPAGKVPQGIPVYNNYIVARNTTFWDRKAMQQAPGDPTRARIYHYLHANNLQKGAVLESVKLPFENRVWFYYQGQLQPAFINTDGQGMLDTPSLIGRVLDDGTTQLYQNTYNILGHRTQKTDPLGRTTKYVYAANNIDLLEVWQTTGLATEESLGSATYNSAHRPLTVTDRAGQVARMTYNAAGQCLTVKDAKNQTTTLVYDGQGYLKSVTGPLAGKTGQTTFTYDSYGRVLTRSDALGYTLTYGYDKLNRLTNITYPDATQRILTYTLLDVTRYTDRLNRQTNYGYDSIRQRVQMTDPLGRTTRFGYDLGGRLGSVRDALGQTTIFDYDLQDRVTARHFADGSQTTYAYEGTTSRLHAQTDARGQTTTWQYNQDNTWKERAYQNAQKPTAAVRLSYDQSYPRRSAMIDGTGVTNYAYVPPAVLGAGNLASVQSPFGTIRYGYDELRRVNSRTVDGAGETRTFNLLGAVSTETNALGLCQYTYVANTRELSTVTLPSGQASTYSYQPNTGDRLLSSLLHKRPAGTTLSQWSYTYDAQHRIGTWSQQRDSSPARVFTLGYDLADQLTSVSLTNPTASYGYTYDTAANRLTETINAATTTATYNSVNELSSLSAPALTDRTYEWDAADRLVAINYSGTSNRTELDYDGFGRPVQIVEKTGGTVMGTKRFLWDGSTLVAEKDGNGQLTKRFFSQGVQAIGGTAPGSYFYARDHLGSVRELTDATGAIRARYDYDPYGRLTKLSGDLEADFGFIGLYRHTPSAFTLSFSRAYDPNLGRWLSRQLRSVQEIANPYLFRRNEPIASPTPPATVSAQGTN